MKMELPIRFINILVTLYTLTFWYGNSLQAESASSFEEVGHFYMKNYSPEDYDAHAQNWAFVQSPEGLLYVANGDGLLEYDGVSWRYIVIPNAVPRALAIDTEGRIYVGGRGEFGYLAADSAGLMSYVSLLEHFSPDDRAFSEVWDIEKTSDGLYIMTEERLYRWNGEEIKVWHSNGKASIYVLGDTLYVQKPDIGLMQMEDDVLVMVPGGNLFQRNLIRGLVPWGEAAYLVITQGSGMFGCSTRRSTEAACTPFKPELTELLSQLQPYKATLLPEGRLAIGTARGVVLLDHRGHLLRILNESTGLRDEDILSTYVDKQGGLWLGLNNGLARIEVTTSLSYFDKTLGLQGNIEKVVRHQGSIYVATSLGVYRMHPAADGTPVRFEKMLLGTSPQCWTLLSTEEALLAGCTGGIFDVTTGRRLWKASVDIFAIHRSRQDPALFYLGFENGLIRIRLDAGRWDNAKYIDGMREMVRSIVEDAQGTLWMGTEFEGVLRLEPASDSEEPIITRFGVADGLPSTWISAITLAGEVRLSGNGEQFRWMDTETGVRQGNNGQTSDLDFVPDTTFSNLLPQVLGNSIFRLTEDPQGRVWIAAYEASGVANPSADGGYTFAPTAMRRVPNLVAWNMHAEAGGQVWCGGSNGLIRLDGNHLLDPSADYPVWIRRISTTGDSLLYNGQLGQHGGAEPWSYLNNALRFSFAAPRYEAPERTHYRTRLDGFDDNWSDWSTETNKDYTNLWEGNYSFRVQALDVYGYISQEDSFSFQILPPWYRSWWAYLIYSLAFAALVAAYTHSNRKKLHRLRELDRLKDEFLANTSHELRTPLFGIIGLIEALLDKPSIDDPEDQKILKTALQSGRRLRKLVTDILDYSKLKHQKLEVVLQPIELYSLVDVVLRLCKPLITKRNLELVNAIEPGSLHVQADEIRIEQVLHNLVSNAIKFTEQGKIEVSAKQQGDEILVQVSDTGIGIAPEQQEKIFEFFVQADSSTQRKYGGTGLGLAVSKQLIELHNGYLKVESVPGEGSVFSFTLEVAEAETKDKKVDKEVNEQIPGIDVIEQYDFTVSEDVLEETEIEQDPTEDLATILIVDDEPVVHHVLNQHLAVKGYRLLNAKSGSQALDIIESKDVDLVLLDIMMPFMTGYEVCHTIRETKSREDLPIIFLSAKDRTRDRVASFDEGGNDYLTKPIGKSELLVRVETHIELLKIYRGQVDEIKELREILPICSWCKQIRDDQGFWSQLEAYFYRNSEVKFSHGICPDCMKKEQAKLMDT
ncbi:MAG: response regulator [Gammaproteobacteria bacterium]|nr:response regulator [Gammaproteobacteria bacterium]